MSANWISIPSLPLKFAIEFSSNKNREYRVIKTNITDDIQIQHTTNRGSFNK